MRTVQLRYGIAAAFAAWIALAALPAGAQQAPAAAVAIDNDDIGGVVRGPKGPEAGVWVIAETRELPVRYIKIVVTDDQGRYVIPDLPKANYDIWVRGYGLVDSPKVKSEPGKQLNLTAVPAPSEKDAAHYYPAIYWYSMMKIPPAEVFGTKQAPAKIKMTDYLNLMKNNGCIGCHQIGQLSTRTIPKFHLDAVKTPRGSLGAPHSVRPGRREHGQPSRRSARRHAVQVSRRLDRARGEGRIALREAGAAAGRRAQHRGDAARLAQRQAVPARPDRQRPALSDRQRLWSAIRAVRARLRRHADPRSGEERGDELRAADHAGHAAGARARQRRLDQDPGALGLLGRGEHLEQQGEQSQLDVRPEGPPLARRNRPQAGQSRLLQEGLEPPVGRGVSARPHQPPGDDVRSEDRQVHRLPDLLRLAPSAVRLRRQRDAVDEHRRRRRQRRLDQHQDAG